jgi:diaminohydroxyphosphoribosylaminopyrimidine deaminase/5-amino-6-(5-phosphoribosylamino)uracil reductase
MTDRPRPAHEEAFMRRALGLAREGWGQTAPNPMVGAVVVRDGHVVGEGFHARFGEAHAEVNALRAAGEQARGATLYVTLEPCRHHGKTPPCTDAIVAAGISTVVVAVEDPSAKAGGGAAILRAAGIEVRSGLLRDEARELNTPFFHAQASDLPWVTIKLAVSMEMAISNARGTTTWLTGPEARRWVHMLRAGHDAIAVGVGTVLADDPQLTVRDVRQPRVPLQRVIFDRRLRTPLGSAVVRTASETPSIILTADSDTADSPRADRTSKLRARGVRVIPATDLRDGLRQLRAAGVHSLLVEGGAAIASAFVTEGFAHRLILLQAPVSLGPGALHAFDGSSPEVLARLERLRVLDSIQLGADRATTYNVTETIGPRRRADGGLRDRVVR